MPRTSACCETLGDGQLAPGQVGGLDLALVALVAGRDVDQPLGRVLLAGRAAVQDHVLDGLAQLGLDVVVDRQVAGVDDAHVHARVDGVEQEHRVDGAAHRLVAAEAEGDVRHPARDARVGQGLLDAGGRLDEVDGVVVVLRDPGRHGEDVGVEDDVLGRKADLVDEDAVGPLADGHLAVGGVGLALLVEGHDHHRGAVAQALAGLVAESVLAFLHRDRIDDGLALHALQPRLDHLPLGGVDHDRHAGDVGLGGDQLAGR